MDELAEPAEPAEICSTPKKILPRSNQISIWILEQHTTSRQIFYLIDKVHFSYHNKFELNAVFFLYFTNFPLFLLVNSGRCPKFVEKMKFCWILIRKTDGIVLSGPYCRWALIFKFTKYKQSKKKKKSEMENEIRSIKKDESRGCNLYVKWRPNCPWTQGTCHRFR